MPPTPSRITVALLAFCISASAAPHRIAPSAQAELDAMGRMGADKLHTRHRLAPAEYSQELLTRVAAEAGLGLSTVSTSTGGHMAVSTDGRVVATHDAATGGYSMVAGAPANVEFERPVAKGLQAATEEIRTRLLGRDSAALTFAKMDKTVLRDRALPTAVEFQRTYAYAYRLYGTDVVSDRAGLRITYNRDGSLSRIDLAVPRPVTETVEDPVPVAEAATRLACDFARRPACMVRGERIGLDSAVVDSVWFGYRWEVRGGVDCLVPALKYRSRNYLHNGTEVLLRGDVSLDDASRMSENRGPPMGNRP